MLTPARKPPNTLFCRVRRLSQQLADARHAHGEEVAELRKTLEEAHGELLVLRRRSGIDPG
jgi:hypothetical protein